MTSNQQKAWEQKKRRACWQAAEDLLRRQQPTGQQVGQRRCTYSAEPWRRWRNHAMGQRHQAAANQLAGTERHALANRVRVLAMQYEL
jgi:hypothetical protein